MRTILLVAAVLAIAAFVIAANAAARYSKADIAQGGYIANRVSLCGHCHTPMTKDGKPDTKRLYAGQQMRPKPPKAKQWASKAINLTPAGELKSWSDAALKKFMMTGVTPEGDKADPPMPQYRLNEKDAKAMTAYLRSLKPAR